MPIEKIIHYPVIDMRESSILSSKIVSQALFGEKIQFIDSVDGWSLIETPDGYRGWVPEGGFSSTEMPYAGDLKVTRLRAHIYPISDTEYGPLITLPYGSKLQALDASDPRWIKVRLPDGKEAFIQKGDIQEELLDLVPFARQFLGLPYTWGGRSSFGYDCSGFVQMLYSRLGIQLPRDARQQILDPRARLVSFDNLQLADLIFWGKSAYEIKHVGMSLGGEEFIHTSVRENKPYVRISNLSDFEWSGNPLSFYPFRAPYRLID